MFVDKAKIYIKSGNGGDGCVSFLSFKGVATGGPDGGDGGKGGDIIFEVSPHINNLVDFKYSVHFKAEDGGRGESKNCYGKGGKDLVIKVPKGTVIRDCETGKIISDMFFDDSRVVVLKGGSGGKGNCKFTNSRRRAPHFAQKGEETKVHEVELELKTIADAGFTGFPNVGKSTLLSVLTSARPKIANYHFTTLSPNLGVAKLYDESFVIADIPGLIEGAAEGAGLGHDFLRHIERTRLIIHVIDISGSEGRDPYEDLQKIKKELKNYSEELAKRPYIVVCSKCDMDIDDVNFNKLQKKLKGEKLYKVSAIAHIGIDELLKGIFESLKDLPPIEELNYEPYVYDDKPKDEFEIVVDDDGSFVVIGGLVDILTRNVVLSDHESFGYFQRKLKEKGVIKALKKAGMKDGDTVRISDIEFENIE